MNKKRKVTKRLAAWFMCLAMVMTIINLPAFTTEVKAAENITTWAQLKAAMESATEPTTIVLTQDIVATAEDKAIFPAETSIVLDLNGYTLDRNLSEPSIFGCVFFMQRSLIDLTIKDSSPAKTGVITGGYATTFAGCIELGSGSLTLLGGTITGNKTLYYGGGIDKYPYAKLMVGGTARVIGNYAYETDIKQWNSDIYFNDNVLDGFSFATGDDVLVTEGEHRAQFGIRFSTGVDIAPELWTLPSYEAGRCFVSNNQREKYRTSVEKDDGKFLLVLTLHDHKFDGIRCTSACELCGMVIEDGIHNMKGEGCTQECSYCHIKVHSNDTYDSKGVCPQCKAHRVDDETLLDYQGVRYRLKVDSKLNTYAEVYGYADDIKESVVIPKTIATSNGVFRVASFANGCFQGCTRVKDVDIQAEVTFIANNTFSGCSSLTDVTIPSSVISVNRSCPPFDGCSSDKLVITVPCTEYLNTVTPTQWGNIKEINRVHDFTAEEAKDEALKSAATCLDEAVYYRSCTVCGHVHESDDDVFEYGEPLGHEYTSETATAPYLKSKATCIKDAVYFHKCSRCESRGATTWIKEGSALGHSWGEYHLDGDQTCTYDGHKTAECTREGCSEENKIGATGAALGHDWEDYFTTDIAATCTEAGSESRHCARCSATTDVAPIVAHGHSFTDYISNGDATTEADGTKTAVCDHGCGETDTVIDEDSRIIEPCESHEFKSLGIEKHKCSVCGIKAAHNYDEATHICSDCNQEDCRATGNHDFSKSEYKNDGEGKHYRICALCTSESEHESCSGGTATCQKKAVCSHCKTEYGELAAHTWDAGEITKIATCKEKGEKTFKCTVEGCTGTKTEEIAIDANNHVNTEVLNAKDATCTEKGYTGDTHCKDCDDTVTGTEIAATGHDMTKTVSAKVAVTCEKDGKEAVMGCKNCDHTEGGAVIKATGHKWDSGKVTKEPTVSAEGVKTFTCVNSGCNETKTEAIAKLPEPKKNEVIEDKTGNDYKVTDPEKKEVFYKAPASKKAKTVTIPASVTIDGVTYKVTKIDDNAFKGKTTVTKITIPSTVTTIGKDAFNGCKKLKTVSVPKNVTEIGKNAFKGCAALTKVTLPSKCTKIGANAFNGCKKMNTITIKSSKLTSKSVSANAFKGLSKNVTIKVPKKQLKAYKKLLKKKGFKGKVKA